LPGHGRQSGGAGYSKRRRSVHDIGKIGIRDDILLKPGRLTDEEFSIIKEHPVIGANIVERLGLWDREKNIIKCHHERFDGKGYPDGLAGENIPMLARILSVADVYDAIASDRAYRKRMEETKILEIMYGGSGTQFDAGVIDAFRCSTTRAFSKQSTNSPTDTSQAILRDDISRHWSSTGSHPDPEIGSNPFFNNWDWASDSFYPSLSLAPNGVKAGQRKSARGFLPTPQLIGEFDARCSYCAVFPWPDVGWLF
jgi:hypothetical protein